MTSKRLPTTVRSVIEQGLAYVNGFDSRTGKPYQPPVDSSLLNSLRSALHDDEMNRAGDEILRKSMSQGYSDIGRYRANAVAAAACTRCSAQVGDPCREDGQPVEHIHDERGMELNRHDVASICDEWRESE